MEKSALAGKVESFIFNDLEDKKYHVLSVPAISLLSFNRFDLALKLLYLELKDKNLSLAEIIYSHDIRSQTLGSFIEFGNDGKNSIDSYLAEFTNIFRDISKTGFSANKSLIPLACDGSILNGAHRLASAIYLNKNVDVLKLDLPPIAPDYRYFHQRAVPDEILDMAAIKFIEYSENIYLAFLWPSGSQNYQKSSKFFKNIVYEKEITLNEQGGLNLLIELYKHMSWVGESKNNYPGVHQKLLECFTQFTPVKIIAFQCESIGEVRKIKQNVRELNGIGFSSIHITDTKEEALRAAKLVFNKNGLHFLNFAKPYAYPEAIEKIKFLKDFSQEKKVDLKDLVVDGSSVLEVYGIRKSKDTDVFIAEDESIFIGTSKKIESHDSELVYHNKEKAELIYDPQYYFEYMGIKYTCFNQLYMMKKSRGESKDKNDCRVMSSFISDNTLKYFFSRSRQRIFYLNLLVRNRLFSVTLATLKITGTYNLARACYRRIIKK